MSTLYGREGGGGGKNQPSKKEKKETATSCGSRTTTMYLAPAACPAARARVGLCCEEARTGEPSSPGEERGGREEGGEHTPELRWGGTLGQ